MVVSFLHLHQQRHALSHLSTYKILTDISTMHHVPRNYHTLHIVFLMFIVTNSVLNLHKGAPKSNFCQGIQLQSHPSMVNNFFNFFFNFVRGSKRVAIYGELCKAATISCISIISICNVYEQNKPPSCEIVFADIAELMKRNSCTKKQTYCIHPPLNKPSADELRK